MCISNATVAVEFVEHVIQWKYTIGFHGAKA